MSKQNLLNLVLLISVIALATFIYTRDEESTRLERLTAIDSDSISHITIRHNAQITQLDKQPDGEWQITQPITIAANRFRINSLLKLLNAPVHGKYTLAQIEPASIGLKDEATSIQFGNNTASHTISFGIVNPATDLRYIQLDNTIYTIEDVYYPLLSSHFGTLVSLNLLPANSKIEKLVLPGQTLSKDDKGLWQSSIDTSADDIVKLIDGWQQAQAFGIHEYLERGDEGKVDIYLQGQGQGQAQALTFAITDTDPWLILARPELGLEYHLDIEAYKKLFAH